MTLLALALALSAHAEPPAPPVAEAGLAAPKEGDRHLAVVVDGKQVGKVWLHVGPAKRAGTFEIWSIAPLDLEHGAGHRATFVVDDDLAVLEGVSEDSVADVVQARTTWKVAGRSIHVKTERGDDVRKARVDAVGPLHTGLEVGLFLAEGLAARGPGRWSVRELAWAGDDAAPTWLSTEIVVSAAGDGPNPPPPGTMRVQVGGAAPGEVLVAADGRVLEVGGLGLPGRLVACPGHDPKDCHVVPDDPDEVTLRDAMGVLFAAWMLAHGPEAGLPATAGDVVAGGETDLDALTAAARAAIAGDPRAERGVVAARGLADVTVCDDEATLKVLGVAGELKLVRVDGHWRIAPAAE